MLDGLYSEASQTMAENVAYYVLTYDLQEAFRVFIYVDRVKGERFKSMAEKRVEESKYLCNVGVCIRNDPPTLKKLFDMNDI